MRKRGFVPKVIDGDTFEVEVDSSTTERIRLEGVDAPELNTPEGMKAKQKLEELVLYKEVEYEEKAKDVYGRIVAQVWVDGINVNEEMKDFIDNL